MKQSKFGKYLCLLIFFSFILGCWATAYGQDKKGSLDPIENLSFQAAEIRSVIRFLADYGQINVVVAPNVSGTVTINLRNVSWTQALKIVGETYDLAIVFEEDNYIRVVPVEEYRKEQSRNEQHKLEQSSMVQLDIKIIRLANTAAAEIITSVQSLMSKRGKVQADERTNALILQEVPNNLERVINFIKELDKPARQIRISAQLLEIYSTDNFELGVDWSAGGTMTPNNARSITQTLDMSANRTTDQLMKYTIGAVQRGWSVDAVISTIVAEGKGRLIAHPEITTIENTEARIQMGQKVPVKQFDRSGNVVIKFEEVGTILRVTPHITADNQILMHLRPERSSLVIGAAGIIINTNNAETNVVVNNGQTAVIGGLTTQDETETEVGVPILKDIPLIGNLFKYFRKETETRDLVIFVTPTIIENDMANSEF